MTFSCSSSRSHEILSGTKLWSNGRFCITPSDVGLYHVLKLRTKYCVQTEKNPSLASDENYDEFVFIYLQIINYEFINSCIHKG